MFLGTKVRIINKTNKISARAFKNINHKKFYSGK